MSGTTVTKHRRLGLGVAAENSHNTGAQSYLGWLLLSLKWIAIAIVLFLELNALIYFIFQTRTMPSTKLYGNDVGFMSYASLEHTINEDLKTKTLPVSINGATLDMTYQDLGLRFSAKRTFAPTKAIGDFWNLPLMQLFTNGRLSTIPAYDVNHLQLEGTIGNYITDIDTQAIDAKLTIPYSLSEDITIRKEKIGAVLNPQIAANQVIIDLQAGENITIEPEGRYPAVRAEQLEVTKEKIESLTENEIAITHTQKPITTIAPVAIRQLLTTKGTEVTVRPVKLERYIAQELSMYFYQAPVPRRISGTTVTAAGANGVGLDQKSAYTSLETALVQPQIDAVELKTAPIKAPKVVNGVYPQTDAGLAALIADFDAEHSGAYNIIVQQMRRGGMGASHAGVEKIIPASTYKAFIAYAALKSIEKGEMTLDTMTPHGTVRDCMYEMIHVSTDHCAISIQDYMGWEKVDTMIHEAGFVNTFINNQGWGSEKYTTALDEYRLFRGYYDGTLLNKEHTAYMLDLFKNQMWRSGIPAGSAPAIVADKVGFYAGRENDVGIVYAPKGDYIIVAMSDGGTFGEISVLARRIYEFFGN